MSDSEERAVNARGIAGLSLLAFAVIGSYELARPAAESLFLQAYGSERLPWVWLAVALTAGVVVSLYGRFARDRHRLAVMSGAATICALLVAGVLLALRSDIPGAPFVLYVFKDVYVVVLIEIFWTFANMVFPLKKARWIYGLFCVAGSLGGASMNIFAGWIAKLAPTGLSTTLAGHHGEGAGTVVALWMLLPMFALIAAGARAGARWPVSSEPTTTPRARAPARYTDGLRLVAQSRYLLLMLALIALTQLAINLVDFSFNRGIEAHEPDTDARTALIGQVYFAINVGALLLQALTGVVLRFVGVAGVLPGIPGVLGATMLAFLFAPHVLLLASAKALSKILDYSLFRAAKEMLYIPLSVDEKTQGKAVVDMLTYRAAKGAASLAVLGLVALDAHRVIDVLTVGVIGLWFAVTLPLIKAHGVKRADRS